MGSVRYIDDGIMRAGEDGAVQLVGGECTGCGLVSFPRATSCARCGGDDVRERLLSRAGTLWTWTTQGFLPKSPYTGTETPETFRPYALGYVELPEGIRIEARLVGGEPASFEIGQAMELTTAPHRTDDDGTVVEMFAFQPAREDAA